MHYCEVYRQTYWLIDQVKDSREVEKFFNKQFNVEISLNLKQAMCLEIETHDKKFKVICVIVMPHKNKYIRMGALAHEVFHATVYNFNRVDIKLNSDSEEAFAYYQEHLVKMFAEATRL